MNKYNSMYSSSSELKLEYMLEPNENVLWKGKPDKNAYILNRIFSGLPFVLLWLIIDLSLIIGFAVSGALGAMTVLMKVGVLCFFMIHLLPVWIWLGGVIASSKRWENTEYVVTDRRIILRSGFLGYNSQNILYAHIKDAHIHVGVIDRMCGVGDIMICTGSHSGSSAQSGIVDIKNVEQVFMIVQRAIRDLQSDVYYPNAYRPNNNPGYNTNYSYNEIYSNNQYNSNNLSNSNNNYNNYN